MAVSPRVALHYIMTSSILYISARVRPRAMAMVKAREVARIRGRTNG